MLGVVFFLIVVWLFVVGTPYSATINSHLGIKPDLVERKVLEEVHKLNEQIRPGSRSPLPDIPVPPYNKMFRDRLINASSVVGAYSPLGYSGLARKFVPDPVDGEGSIPPPPLRPPPVRIVTRAGHGVLLDRESLIEHLGTKQSTGDHQANSHENMAQAYKEDLGITEQLPRDFRYVSVAGLYDIRQWRRRLRDTDGLPAEWRRSSLAVVNVVLERQTFDGSKQRWGEPEVISPLPDAIGWREFPTVWTIGEAQEAVEWIKENQDKIIRPAFAPMVEGVTWVEPDIQPSLSSDHPKHQEVKLSEQKQIQRFDQRQVDTNSQEMDHLKHQVTENIPYQEKKKTDLDKEETGISQLNPSHWWKVWRHDLTVQPGMSYRYRLRVDVINPYFQRSQLVGGLREAHFHQILLESPFSQWSDPVAIDPVYRFFMVGGSSVEREATVEVWRVFNGYPQVSEFRVKPGDMIGGVVSMSLGDEEVDVDMNVGAIVVDLMDVESTENFGGRTTLVLILDTVTNQVIERTIEEDRNSPIRAMLIEGGSSSEEDTSDESDSIQP